MEYPADNDEPVDFSQELSHDIWLQLAHYKWRFHNDMTGSYDFSNGRTYDEKFARRFYISKNMPWGFYDRGSEFQYPKPYICIELEGTADEFVQEMRDTKIIFDLLQDALKKSLKHHLDGNPERYDPWLEENRAIAAAEDYQAEHGRLPPASWLADFSSFKK